MLETSQMEAREIGAFRLNLMPLRGGEIISFIEYFELYSFDV